MHCLKAEAVLRRCRILKMHSLQSETEALRVKPCKRTLRFETCPTWSEMCEMTVKMTVRLQTRYCGSGAISTAQELRACAWFWGARPELSKIKMSGNTNTAVQPAGLFRSRLRIDSRVHTIDVSLRSDGISSPVAVLTRYLCLYNGRVVFLIFEPRWHGKCADIAADVNDNVIECIRTVQAILL